MIHGITISSDPIEFGKQILEQSKKRKKILLIPGASEYFNKSKAVTVLDYDSLLYGNNINKLCNGDFSVLSSKQIISDSSAEILLEKFMQDCSNPLYKYSNKKNIYKKIIGAINEYYLSCDKKQEHASLTLDFISDIINNFPGNDKMLRSEAWSVLLKTLPTLKIKDIHIVAVNPPYHLPHISNFIAKIFSLDSSKLDIVLHGYNDRYLLRSHNEILSSLKKTEKDVSFYRSSTESTSEQYLGIAALGGASYNCTDNNGDSTDSIRTIVSQNIIAQADDIIRYVSTARDHNIIIATASSPLKQILQDILSSKYPDDIEQNTDCFFELSLITLTVQYSLLPSNEMIAKILQILETDDEQFYHYSNSFKFAKYEFISEDIYIEENSHNARIREIFINLNNMRTTLSFDKDISTIWAEHHAILKLIVPEKMYEPEIWDAITENVISMSTMLSDAISSAEQYLRIIDAAISNMSKVISRQDIQDRKKIRIISPSLLQFLKADHVIYCPTDEGQATYIGSSIFHLEEEILSNESISDINLALAISNPNTIISQDAENKTKSMMIFDAFFPIAELDMTESRDSSSKYKLPANFAKPPKYARPTYFSPSSFELLMNNPYIYYVKYILSLYKLSEDKVTESIEFGLLVHSVLYHYAKTIETSDTNDKSYHDIFMSCAKGIIQKNHGSLYEYFYAIWSLRLSKIARMMEKYESDLPKNVEKYAEKEISAQLCVHNDLKINLKARCDRIDIDHINKTIIVTDYKTGNLPSAKAVNRMLSPQLVLEGLIISLQSEYEGYDITMQYIQLSGMNKDDNIMQFKLDQERAKNDISNAINQYLVYNKEYDINRKAFCPEEYKGLIRST